MPEAPAPFYDGNPVLLEPLLYPEYGDYYIRFEDIINNTSLKEGLKYFVDGLLFSNMHNTERSTNYTFNSYFYLFNLVGGLQDIFNYNNNIVTQ